MVQLRMPVSAHVKSTIRHTLSVQIYLIEDTLFVHTNRPLKRLDSTLLHIDARSHKGVAGLLTLFSVTGPQQRTLLSCT